jgi:transposase
MREQRRRLVYEVMRRRARGESIRSIARTLRIDRRTVRRMLRDVDRRRREGDDALQRCSAPQRAPRPSKLDAHVPFISDLLSRYPDIRATRLHEELVGQGFDGGYTIVRQYLRAVRPRPQHKTYTLVQTDPGKQAQADWSPYKLVDGRPIYCFSCVLGYSRYQYARFSTDMKQHTVFRHLRRAFAAFGGVPHECVFDSMPGIVDRWELDRPVLNLHAVDFATYYGFEIHVAPRADGPYKGKVERPFRYIEESLLNARTFYTVEQANATMAWWLDSKANVREHRMTKRRPVDALVDEVDQLRPLPEHPYDDRELAYRLVDSYGYIDFDGNRYRAPVPVGQWVYVLASEDEVEIVTGPARRVALHPRSPHNAGDWVPPPSKHKKRSIRELLALFEGWGSTARRYAERVRIHKHYAALELSRIAALQHSYALEDLLKALRHADAHGAYSARHVERILCATAEPRTYEDRLAGRIRQHISQAMAQAPVKQRGLGDYARLLCGSDLTQDVQQEPDDGQQEEDPA